MGAIVPRWEWRTFDNGISGAEVRIRALASDRRASEETYIVSDRGDCDTKIRDCLIDIKALQRVNGHGLELWVPVLKAGFPLTALGSRAVCNAWQLEPLTRVGHTWTLQALLDLIVSEPSLTVVHVSKQRYGCVVDDCLVEIADLTFDETPMRTIAVEMSDPHQVWHTVEALGLSAYENVNYVKALKRFLSVQTR